MQDLLPVLLLCPDDVDVMVMQPNSDSGVDIALTLALSQLRPRVAMGLSPNPLVVSSTSAVDASLIGWRSATAPCALRLSSSSALHSH